MNISIETLGCYFEHKIFFDEMAIAMKKRGHRVGIITDEREKDPFSGEDIKEKILKSLGFKPDFIHLWGATETIANGNLWKCQKMDLEDVLVHFSSDATEMKRYTDRWIIKVLDSSQPNKF